MSISCYSCGNYYERIGSHWAQSDCDYPELSENQKEICIGMLLGDGYINSQNRRNSMLRAKMIKPEFLHWLKDKLSIVHPTVELYMTSQESFQDAKTRFSHSVTSEDNYSDIYEFRTMRHPFFNTLRDWYSSGEKRFPNDIKLTPTIIKMWYVCDGSFDKRISIYASNESTRSEWLKSLFDGFNPRWQTTSECIRFKRKESQELLDYMGEPVPGFEYKWGQ